MKIRTLIILTFTFYGLTAFSSAASASLEIKSQFEHYDIKGKDAWELRKAMRKRGVREHGRSFDARTDWHVKWNYNFQSADEKDTECVMKSVKMSLTIHYKMPRWINRDGASEELLRRWDKYYAALLNHEEGHGNIGRKAAAEIEEMIENAGKGVACKNIKDAINAAAEIILEKYRMQELEYDASTNHGRSQGVNFP